MNYVVAAYTITVLLLGLYAWSIHWRRKGLGADIDERASGQPPDEERHPEQSQHAADLQGTEHVSLKNKTKHASHAQESDAHASDPRESDAHEPHPRESDAHEPHPDESELEA